jgi:YidC/Oxa1 family membrane protein insertase
MISFFTIVFYQPIYNVLVFLMTLLPWADAGVIIILVTVIVRLILFPLSQKSIRTQLKMKDIAPELEAMKLKYKDDKQEQAKQTMAFYKEKGVNPFSGFFAILIQFPIIISLYRIFYAGGISQIDPALLYSFVHVPNHTVSMVFLGLVNLTGKNIIFALLAAITQFFQAQIITPAQPPVDPKAKKSLGTDLARSMTFQSKYVFPIMIFFIAYAVSAAVSLYWITSNTFSICQELYVRRQYKKQKAKLLETA